MPKYPLLETMRDLLKLIYPKYPLFGTIRALLKGPLKGGPGRGTPGMSAAALPEKSAAPGSMRSRPEGLVENNILGGSGDLVTSYFGDL